MRIVSIVSTVDCFSRMGQHAGTSEPNEDREPIPATTVLTNQWFLNPLIKKSKTEGMSLECLWRSVRSGFPYGYICYRFCYFSTWKPTVQASCQSADGHNATQFPHLNALTCERPGNKHWKYECVQPLSNLFWLETNLSITKSLVQVQSLCSKQHLRDQWPSDLV